ncbi:MULTISPECIES: hypothetical protein [Lactobacillaceae]|uniref:hypothetical protein n=1 Tax=Lactobacillaceae TaxID=33958 RepID=UPI001B3B2023|nr:hypothetical protein [Lactobacillus sp. HBUAS51381]
MIKTYLKGLFPFALIFFLHNLNTQNGDWSLALSWWNVYLVVSYLVFFPLLYGQFWRHVDQSADKGKQLNQPRKNAEQESLRIGSNYGNTGHFGFARIGEADGEENTIERWGMSLVVRLFLILAGPLVWIYLWLKRQRKLKK